MQQVNGTVAIAIQLEFICNTLSSIDACLKLSTDSSGLVIGPVCVNLPMTEDYVKTNS